MRLASFFALLFVTACSGATGSVPFRVDVDEEITGGTLMLNGEAVPLERQGYENSYTAEWTKSDASGEIVVTYPDGATARCEIGYVTHGMYKIQHYSVVARKCRAISG